MNARRIECFNNDEGHYKLGKETIEKIFGMTKEQHGFRYTQYIGKTRMEILNCPQYLARKKEKFLVENWCWR